MSSSPPATASEKRPGGRLFVVSAPSGTGKTTITSRLQSLNVAKFSISHTTRPPRRGERDGVDYFFTESEEFIRMRDGGAFLEWAEVFGNFYGTEKTWVQQQLAANANIMLEIDVQGAKKVRQAMPEAILVFIRPPSLDALFQRLTQRGTDSEESVARRFAEAQSEMAHANVYDYVIINDDWTGRRKNSAP